MRMSYGLLSCDVSLYVVCCNCDSVCRPRLSLAVRVPSGGWYVFGVGIRLNRPSKLNRQHSHIHTPR